MGDTFRYLRRGRRCRDGSVTRWTSVCGLWPVGWTGKMAVLCREFGISRNTGYKIFSRYQDCGVEGLTDRSRRPCRHARQLPFQIEKAIIQLKHEYPNWGAPNIRERLRRKHSDVHCPAISTVHAILDRHGLVKRRRRRITSLRGRRSRALTRRTICGAPITRASSRVCRGTRGSHRITKYANSRAAGRMLRR
jgi:Homeodomain-like domain